MIIENTLEKLNLKGNEKCDFNFLYGQAEDIHNGYDDLIVENHGKFGISFQPTQTADGEIVINSIFDTKDGRHFETDITEGAFEQTCQRLGIPAMYARKCMSHKDPRARMLGVQNVNTWGEINAGAKPSVVRFYNPTNGESGRVNAVLTNKWNAFDSVDVFRAVEGSLMKDSSSRYELNQAFLSSEKLHLRFVDFDNPITAGDEKLHPGVTIASSDVGRGALVMKFFLYRFACKNGLVISKAGGELFRKTHIGSFRDTGSYDFLKALEGVGDVVNATRKKIEMSMSKTLDVKDFNLWMDKCRKELHIGEAGEKNLRELVDTTYGKTMFGVINAVTENAQKYTLEDRFLQETWAGNMLMAA